MMRDHCNCGPPHKVGDPEIIEEPEWTTLGWLALTFLNMTPRPKYISIVCTICHTELGRTRDPQRLAHRSVPKIDEKHPPAS